MIAALVDALALSVALNVIYHMICRRLSNNVIAARAGLAKAVAIIEIDARWISFANRRISELKEQRTTPTVEEFENAIKVAGIYREMEKWN